MQPTVVFRGFEERDIDFVYKCKNDEKLNSMIVGQYHPFTYEEATKWVRGCIGEHDTYKFWAIATNDDERRIIGWLSLSEIDRLNRKACFHGLVIGDSEYNDGFAWIESNLFVLSQAFEVYGLNRLYGTHIADHKTSSFSVPLFFWTFEGVLREAINKNGDFYDLNYAGILKDEYFLHKSNGDYDIKSILKRIVNLKKTK